MESAQAILQNLVHMLAAYILALPIGWNRERMSQGAGLRTFPLVSMAACTYTLIGTSVFVDEEPLSRVLYGLIVGIGFIGGGAILKNGHRVSGTATAASIWNTGAIGAATGFELYELAVTLAIANFLTLYFLTRFKSKDSADHGIVDEISD